MRNPFITGDGIYLRPIEAEDSNTYLPWVNDHSIISTMKHHLPYNAIEHQKWLGEWTSDRSAFLLAICLKENDSVIGHTGLFDINPIDRSAMFAILIGDKTQWGKGYGTQVASMIIKYGFDTQNLHRISLTVNADNFGGIKAYKRAGYVEEGRLRQATFRNGAYTDVLIMSILQKDWKEANLKE